MPASFSSLIFFCTSDDNTGSGFIGRERGNTNTL